MSLFLRLIKQTSYPYHKTYCHKCISVWLEEQNLVIYVGLPVLPYSFPKCFCSWIYSYMLPLPLTKAKTVCSTSNIHLPSYLYKRAKKSVHAHTALFSRWGSVQLQLLEQWMIFPLEASKVQGRRLLWQQLNKPGESTKVNPEYPYAAKLYCKAGVLDHT